MYFIRIALIIALNATIGAVQNCPAGNLDCAVQLWPSTVVVDGKTRLSSEFVSKPKPLNLETIKIPRAKLNGKGSDSLVLLVTVNKDGTTGDIKTMRALNAYLNQKAIDAARGWKFEPARDQSNQPTKVRVAVDVHFKAK